MRVEHPQCLAAAEKWLEAGIGVRVTGDVGSGKSIVLAEIARRAQARGVHVLSFSGASATADVPLSAFALHRLGLPGHQGERRSVGAIRDHFLEELQGRHNLVVVDDIDLVDPASLTVIDNLIAVSGSGLVCSTRLGAQRGPWGGVQVGGQPLAQVAVDPIGIRGVARILEERLEGAVDIALIAAVTAWSGGNARAALALVDSAAWADAIGRVDGAWAELSPIEEVPHTLVADSFCAALEPAELAALEALAWFGPLELEQAVRLVGTDAVQRLLTLERVSSYRTHAGRSVLVAVSPPCLGHAVRLGVNVVRRHELAEQFSVAFGSTVHLAPSGEPPLIAVPDSPEPVPVVVERLAAQTVLRRDAWLSRPGVATALPLLESLMNGSPPADEVDEIFSVTPLDPGPATFATAEFVMKRARWVAFRESDVARGVATLEAHLADAGEYAPLLRAQILAFECSQKGSAELVAAAADFPRAPSPENVWYAELCGGLLMESGRPDAVLDLLSDWDLESDQDAGSATDPLRALRADALLLDGQVREALQYSQECLSAAYDRLDPLGIRMHSRGVATARMFSGDSEGAWRVLSTVIRLGPPGPVNVPYYQRILAMASVLRARRDDVALSAALLEHLRGLPRTYPLVLDAMTPWAQAELLCSQGRRDEAGRLLWDAGVERRDLGFPGSAVLCWLLRAEVCSDDELVELKAIWEKAPVPLFAPLLELHTRMAQGDADTILDALAATGPVVGRWLIDAALEVVAKRRQDAGLPPLSRTELAERAGNGVATEADASALPNEPAEALSDRELEVAMLARSGLSNREIANRLYLSVRTVENHMYRTLRKLGLNSRAELSSDWDPDAPL